MNRRKGRPEANFRAVKKVLSMLMCTVVIGTTLMPSGFALPIYAGDQGAASLTVDSGQSADTESRVENLAVSTAENSAGDGEEDQARLFQAMNGLDLRTYATQGDWYLGIAKMECRDRLYTEKQTTDYGGNVVTNKYLNTPAAGCQYVIINLTLAKTLAGGSSFRADEMTLTVGDNAYRRILEDSFLINHDYASFPNSEVLAGSKTGDVIFEVTDLDADKLSDWKHAVESGSVRLQAGTVSAVSTEVNGDEMIAVPLGGYLVDRQFQTEQELLKEYKAGSYTIQSPFLVRDPYGQTPLAGVAMFRTPQEIARVRVTVEGKQPAQDITYVIDSGGTEHEIPVIGLYPKYQNQVSFTALDKSGREIAGLNSGIIKNAAVNTADVSGYQQPRIRTNSSYLMEPGLTLLMTNNRVVVDDKAEVRWFQSMSINGVWGINEMTDRGTFYFQDNGSTWGKEPAVIYEMTWTGKVIAQYLYDNAPNDYADGHHDLAESIGGDSFLYLINREQGFGAMQEVDKNTGAIIRKRYNSEMMTATHNLEVRNADRSDWAHQNTITPTADGNYLISFRNQHMVFKYNYKTNEILWALTPSHEFQIKNNPQVADKLVMLDLNTKDKTGASPEWFYSQHNVTALPDLDGNDRTEDILLLDNGVDRSLTAATSPKYSRIVHYRIDLDTMTATQIYSAGKDRSSFYSAAWGSAQYLPKTGNYIGTGSSNEVTEFTSKGAVVWSVEGNASVYRAYRISVDSMARGYRDMGTLKGKAFMRVGEETPFKKTEVDSSWRGELRGSLIQDGGIYLHGAQLMLKGQAYINSASARKNVFLIADDGKNQYWAPLLSASGASSYDNTVKTAKPLSILNLPAGRYNLGILVEEAGLKIYEKTNYYIEKTGALKTVVTDDGGQREIVEELIAKSKDEANTLTNPIVVVNPFEKAPLSAIATFHTPKETTVSVTVRSKAVSGNRVPADVTYTVSGAKTTDHVIPLVGLYANYENTVELTTSDGKSSILKVKTGAVNPSYTRNAEIKATAEQRGKTAAGLTFLTPAGAQTVPMAIDVNGDLRWIYLCAAAAPLETKPLSDGHFLVPSDRPSTEIFVTDAETALEIDLTGRIYAEYFLDGQPHHEVFERENGNLIFALSRRNSTSIEDYMAEVERETGKTIRTWDFRKILGIPEYDPAFDPEKGGTDDVNGPHRASPSIQSTAGNHPYSDWFHQNSLSYDEGNPMDPSDDAIYVTARHQSMLLKINAEKGAGDHPATDSIEWIYTDPSWLPQSSLDLNSLVLTPKDAKTKEALQRLLEEKITLETDKIQAKETKDTPFKITEPAIREAEQVMKLGVQEGDKQLNQTDSAAIEAFQGGAGSAGLSEVMEGSPGEDAGNVDLSEAAEAGPKVAAQVTPGRTKAVGGSEHPYIYGPHAVEHLGNGDLIIYDNYLYGSKMQTNNAAELFSRAVLLRVDERRKTFEIRWEYGSELGNSHYTPFIGDVDYLGTPLKASDEPEAHYLINFGGITKNANGEACDVVGAMLGGTISASVQEYSDGEVIWNAYLKGETGKAASVYRAERVDMSLLPVSGEDYRDYKHIENRGMYSNTPQADAEEVKVSILGGAKIGTIPVTWTLLQDEGNRLIGTFTLPHVMTDAASENSKIRNVYVVLKTASKERIYKAGYTAAQPLLGVHEDYYKFEIMKDNEAAQIRLLVERTDDVWILGDTGEIASADMEYVTGDVPIIDPIPPVAEVKYGDDARIVQQIADAGGQAENSLIRVEKGTLEPGKKYVYRDLSTGRETDLAYSEARDAYIALIEGRLVGAAELSNNIVAVNGSIKALRTGVVADDRDKSVSGIVRTGILPNDVFYIYNRLKDGAMPYQNPLRVLAMDVDGDNEIGSCDITTLIQRWLQQ